MKPSYYIYQVLIMVPHVEIETLLATEEGDNNIKHVRPTSYAYHSKYSYRGNCKRVGRITNIRMKSDDKGN